MVRFSCRAHIRFSHARNDYAMLEQIGGECAGAVSFVPAGDNLPERNYGYRALSSQELAATLKELPKRPLLAGEDGIRLSLAGAQDKVAVRIEGNEISLPLGGAPSTPRIGLPAAKVEAKSVEDVDYLLVERYDRPPTAKILEALPPWSGFIRRIFVRSKASSPKRNIRRKADPLSGNVLRCCAKCPLRL